MALGTKTLQPADLDTFENERLVDELKKAKEELFNLRFQSATGHLESHGRVRAVKRDIARIYTIIRERELGLRATPAPIEAPEKPAKKAAKAKTETAEQTAQANAEKQAKKDQEKKDQDKYNEDGTLKSGVAYDVTLDVQIPEDLREQLKYEKNSIVLKDSIMVDLNAQGGLDTAPGKNGAMRRYREALDMNKPGEIFRPRLMAGRMLLVRIKHEEYQGNIQERVDSVAKLP